MSGFGGSFGGGRNSGGRNSGRSGGRGRGRGRSGRGRGSNNNNNNNNNSNSNDSGNYPKPLLNPCSNFTKNGNCQHGNNCRFAHVVKLHAVIDASSPKQNNSGYNNNNNRYNNNNNNNGKNMEAATACALWETGGAMKLFTGSKDGFWRLWNFVPNTGFVKEFEHNMGGPVYQLVVASNFLFCAFEGISPLLPEITVGMVHAWNLANPADPPLEFHMSTLAPYAHAQGVTQLIVNGQTVVSGSKDGAIKLWSFDPTSNGFKLTQTFMGHARDITGLAVADTLLWSSSTDGSIRIWDIAKAECHHLISMTHPVPQNSQPGSGHTNAVTSLVCYKSAADTFILSGSLDGQVKAWKGTTGECVASEGHGEGVVSMTMAADSTGKPLVLLGLESGNIMARNLEPTPKIPQGFSPILNLSQRFTVGHDGAVKALSPGTPGTFYSAGMDGKVLVFEFTGDLGL